MHEPSSRRWHRAWTAWLVVLALAPDVDYVVAALRLPGPPVIRVTHSLGFISLARMAWAASLSR